MDTHIQIHKRSFYLYYTLFIFLITIQIQTIQTINNDVCSSTSKISSSFTSTSCFNEIIKFQGSYRAGQFTIRNDGVLLTEFSSGAKRLFYGLNPNGRGYFNDTTNKIIDNIGKEYWWKDHTQESTD